jgi:hypothetical protein
MIRLPKDQADGLVLSILTELSKVEDKEFAEQSLKIMDNAFDNTIFIGIILNKAKPSLFSKQEENLKETMVSIIGSFFYNTKREGVTLPDCFSKDLTKFMEKEDFSIKGYNESTRMKFAVNQFVNAFLEYERLEKEYPSVMKFM